MGRKNEENKDTKNLEEISEEKNSLYKLYSFIIILLFFPILLLGRG